MIWEFVHQYILQWRWVFAIQLYYKFLQGLRLTMCLPPRGKMIYIYTVIEWIHLNLIGKHEIILILLGLGSILESCSNHILVTLLTTNFTDKLWIQQGVTLYLHFNLIFFYFFLFTIESTSTIGCRKLLIPWFLYSIL